MKRTDEIQSRRLPDVEWEDNALRREQEEPGVYYRVLNDPEPYPPSNLTKQTWYVVTPNGLHGSLHNHTVREEDDGSISVKPGDGSSNSILVNGAVQPEGWKPGDGAWPKASWHGYITRGLWWSLS